MSYKTQNRELGGYVGLVLQSTFNSEARTYDQTTYVIPHYNEVLDNIVSLIVPTSKYLI